MTEFQRLAKLAYDEGFRDGVTACIALAFLCVVLSGLFP